MKKIRFTLMIVLAAAFVFTACSVQSPDENSTAQSASSGDASNDANAIYGNVTSIDGSTITLALGTLNQDAVPDGDGQPGAQPSGNRQNGGGQPPVLSGQPSAMPSGGEQPSMLTLTGETLSITVTDESVITAPEFNAIQPNSQESSQPSGQKTGLAAIQTGSVLKIVYASDNETIQTIAVINGFGGGFHSGPNGGSTDSTPSASASPA